MHRLIVAILAIGVLTATSAFAQDAPPPPPSDATAAPEPAKKKIENLAGKKDTEKDKEASAASTEDIVPLAGDTVHFKSGSVLKGVQVIRETPSGVEVKVTEADTLLIPRKQIDHIEYVKVEEAPTPEQQAAEMSILKGQKVSTDFFGKLTAALPDDALEYKDADVVTALEELAKKTGVTIEVTDPVKKLGPKKRLWTTKLDTGANLANLLEDGLLKSFPNFQLDFPSDKIVVSMKSDTAADDAPPAQ